MLEKINEYLEALAADSTIEEESSVKEIPGEKPDSPRVVIRAEQGQRRGSTDQSIGFRNLGEGDNRFDILETRSVDPNGGTPSRVTVTFSSDNPYLQEQIQNRLQNDGIKFEVGAIGSRTRIILSDTSKSASDLLDSFRMSDDRDLHSLIPDTQYGDVINRTALGTNTPIEKLTPIKTSILEARFSSYAQVSDIPTPVGEGIIEAWEVDYGDRQIVEETGRVRMYTSFNTDSPATAQRIANGLGADNVRYLNGTHLEVHGHMDSVAEQMAQTGVASTPITDLLKRVAKAAGPVAGIALGGAASAASAAETEGPLSDKFAAAADTYVESLPLNEAHRHVSEGNYRDAAESVLAEGGGTAGFVAGSIIAGKAGAVASGGNPYITGAAALAGGIAGSIYGEDAVRDAVDFSATLSPEQVQFNKIYDNLPSSLPPEAQGPMAELSRLKEGIVSVSEQLDAASKLPPMDAIIARSQLEPRLREAEEAYTDYYECLDDEELVAVEERLNGQDTKPENAQTGLARSFQDANNPTKQPDNPELASKYDQTPKPMGNGLA